MIEFITLEDRNRIVSNAYRRLKSILGWACRKKKRDPK